MVSHLWLLVGGLGLGLTGFGFFIDWQSSSSSSEASEQSSTLLQRLFLSMHAP